MYVQRGLISLLDTATSSEISLVTPVPVGSSFVIASARGVVSDPRKSMARVELTTIVNDEWTKLKAWRDSGANDEHCYVEWQVISGDEFTVQYVEHTLGGTSEDVAIDEVDLGEAFIVNSHIGKWTDPRYSCVRAVFKDKDTITLYQESYTAGYGSTVSVYIVEWHGASVQSGQVTIALGDTVETAGITNVNLDKAFLVYNLASAGSTNPSAFARGRIEEYDDGGIKQRVEFIREFGNWPVYMSYFVVAHDAIFVQSGLLTVDGASGTFTLATAVDISKAFMPTNSVGNAYQGEETANTMHYHYNTHKLFQDGANSKITIERTNDTDDLFASWFVVKTIAHRVSAFFPFMY